MTADEYTPPKQKYFVTFEVPEDMAQNGAQSSRTPGTLTDLRRIFARENIYLPSGTNLADLDFLRRKHDLTPRYVHTYDARLIRTLLSSEDHVVVIRIADPLQFLMYTGFGSLAEHDPCMM